MAIVSAFVMVPVTHSTCHGHDIGVVHGNYLRISPTARLYRAFSAFGILRGTDHSAKLHQGLIKASRSILVHQLFGDLPIT